MLQYLCSLRKYSFCPLISNTLPEFCSILRQSPLRSNTVYLILSLNSKLVWYCFSLSKTSTINTVLSKSPFEGNCYSCFFAFQFIVNQKNYGLCFFPRGFVFKCFYIIGPFHFRQHVERKFFCHFCFG